MDHRNSVTDDIWNRVQDRLLSANVRFVREVRRLLDLAQPEAVAAISPMLASEDIGGLQPLYTMLANVSQNLWARGGDP
jgi:hypothetical protein